MDGIYHILLIIGLLEAFQTKNSARTGTAIILDFRFAAASYFLKADLVPQPWDSFIRILGFGLTTGFAATGLYDLAQRLTVQL